MPDVNIDQIAAAVLRQMEQQKIQDQRQAEMSEEATRYDEEMKMLAQMLPQLQLGVRSVIPDEEPHTYALETILEWLQVAYQAKAGELRIRRHAVLPYTSAELSRLPANAILPSPADIITFLERSEKKEEKTGLWDLNEPPLRSVGTEGIMASRQPPVHRELIDHALAGGISGGAVSILVTFLLYLALH
jgi:hypothetical protein